MRNPEGRKSRATFAVVLGLVLAACSGPPPSRPLDPVRTQDGLTVYLGVMPAALIQGHDPGTTGEMHKGAVRSPLTHHVMVAIFDAASGARVTDAVVSATVVDHPGNSVTQPLEPMPVAGAQTYGNYFEISRSSKAAAIDVVVSRPGQRPTRFEFAYSNPY